jgi:hypothetical protein
MGNKNKDSGESQTSHSTAMQTLNTAHALGGKIQLLTLQTYLLQFLLPDTSCLTFTDKKSQTMLKGKKTTV